MGQKLLIAGGGTGGHLFTGIAVAEEWVLRGGEVVFVGTSYGLETELIPKYGFSLELIPVSHLKGQSFLRRLKTLVGLPGAFIKSWRLLKRLKPQRVLGIGGYASGPLVLTAVLMGFRTAVIDQNSIPGWTNRMLGKWVDLVFLTFKGSEGYFKKTKVRLYGNPVIKKRRAITSTNKTTEAPTILVCGGSQGAHTVNEKFLEAIDEVKDKIPELRIIHQTGKADYDWVLKEMKKKVQVGAIRESPLLAPFFDDMETHYEKRPLVLSRAGAGTLSEIALWGLPSILIPYPFSADDHQQKNAAIFEKQGAAEVICQKDLTGSRLAKSLMAILSDRECFDKMSERALSLANPDAAKRVVDDLMDR